MSHRIARPRDVVLRKSFGVLLGLLAITTLLLFEHSPVLANKAEAYANAAYATDTYVTETYVVMPGDRLASVARRYCTTWQELYDLNRHILGPNPDYLPAGITITVINRCGSGGGVYDRGPTAHAQGTVSGSTYYVVYGDTIYSISNRFGVSEHALMRVNNLHSPYSLQAGQTLTIPGFGPGPTPVPPVYSWLTISQPTSSAYLPSTFNVSGRGAGLFEGNVVVQAKDSHGNVLTERATTLQGSGVGTGGEGVYSVDLTVNASPNTPGSIVVYSPGTSANASVPVTFNGGMPPPPVTSWVTIEYPTSGSHLPTTFTVSGRGAGLFEGNVVVQAKDVYGGLLAEKATTLQGSNVGTGGEGSYSVQLAVNVGPNTPGTIVVYSPGSSSAYASIAVTFNGGSTDSWVIIDYPAEGAYLPTTFSVGGRGRNLYEGNVVVQARDLNGRVLVEQAATLQGSNVGTGGEGTWSLQMTINQNVDGRIVAFSNSPTYVEDSVSVRYNNGGSGPGPSTPVKDFAPGECRVTPRSGAPSYGYPDGPQIGQFSGNSEYNVIRGVYTAADYWYYVDIAPGTSSPSVWVKGSDLASQQGTCTW